jgi:hypothetical protein
MVLLHCYFYKACFVVSGTASTFLGFSDMGKMRLDMSGAFIFSQQEQAVKFILFLLFG